MSEIANKCQNILEKCQKEHDDFNKIIAVEAERLLTHQASVKILVDTIIKPGADGRNRGLGDNVIHHFPQIEECVGEMLEMNKRTTESAGPWRSRAWLGQLSSEQLDEGCLSRSRSRERRHCLAGTPPLCRRCMSLATRIALVRQQPTQQRRRPQRRPDARLL